MEEVKTNNGKQSSIILISVSGALIFIFLLICFFRGAVGIEWYRILDRLSGICGEMSYQLSMGWSIIIIPSFVILIVGIIGLVKKKKVLNIVGWILLGFLGLLVIYFFSGFWLFGFWF